MKPGICTNQEMRVVELPQPDGDLKQVEVLVTWDHHIDRGGYGADADGNRGVTREWNEITAFDIIEPGPEELTGQEIAEVELLVNGLNCTLDNSGNEPDTDPDD